MDPISFYKKIKEFNIDICFNALHGPFGEDGQVQQILFNNKIKFSHSGVKTSTIAFNKHLTKKAIEKTGIDYPQSILLNKSKLNEKTFKYTLKQLGPFVLKPVSSGSSYGVQLIKSKENLNGVHLLNLMTV